MFAKIQNNQVVEWPITNLTSRFPSTSFPVPLTAADLPEGYVMVGAADTPQYGINQKIVPALPTQQNGEWTQGWDVLDLTPEEIAQRDQTEAVHRKQERTAAYLQESDPLFFQEQRGEVPPGTWLAKIAEIRSRYPQ